MVAVCAGAPEDTKEMEWKELIERINQNTAAQKEQNERWERELELAPLEIQEQEPTELELLLQKWVQAGEAALSPEPEGVELPSREPEEVRKLPPPQPRPPPLETSPVLPATVPYPLLLDTLPVCLDLPALHLEPRSLHHRPQLYTWFPTPLSPITQTLLGCCQTSLKLPLFAASLPLGDRHRYASPQPSSPDCTTLSDHKRERVIPQPNNTDCTTLCDHKRERVIPHPSSTDCTTLCDYKRERVIPQPSSTDCTTLCDHKRERVIPQPSSTDCTTLCDHKRERVIPQPNSTLLM
ncbi:UNVERIFIED_CONTAM: hypothetical protein FKN15_069037 [Acipenser sinensis]